MVGRGTGGGGVLMSSIAVDVESGGVAHFMHFLALLYSVAWGATE